MYQLFYIISTSFLIISCYSISHQGPNGERKKLESGININLNPKSPLMKINASEVCKDKRGQPCNKPTYQPRLCPNGKNISNPTTSQLGDRTTTTWSDCPK